MDLPQRQSTPCYDWETESDCEYTTVQPPVFIKRARVDEALDQSHQIRFCQAIRTLLHSKAAEVTVAQLVDGLPLARFATSTQGMRWEPPILEHETLCPGVVERAKSFRDNLDPASLGLPVEVLERYQVKPAGSRESKLPFLELIAVAIHRIAVLLYNQGSFHKECDPTVEESRLCYSFSPHYYPTPFCLDQYSDPEQYPDGVADVAGYWAENWIFGGVVIFSRGESGVECNDVWLHSFRSNTTRRVWAISDGQLSKLLNFLESDEQGHVECPLPLVLEKTNHRRIDADNCIPEHNIYRDRWERKMRFGSRSTWEFAQGGNCVDNEIHYPFSDDDEDLY